MSDERLQTPTFVKAMEQLAKFDKALEERILILRQVLDIPDKKKAEALLDLIRSGVKMLARDNPDAFVLELLDGEIEKIKGE